MRVTFTISFQFFIQLRDFRLNNMTTLWEWYNFIIYDAIHQDIIINLMKIRPEITANSDKIKITMDVKQAAFIVGTYQDFFHASWKSDFAIIENALREKYKNVLRQ